MQFQVNRVRGTQAEMAKRLGLVKLTRSSAKNMFDLGVPFIIVGNKVNDFHFFGGWHLAHEIQPERYLAEGWDFDQMVRNWSVYNDNTETGKAAFFVDKKYAHVPTARRRR